MSNAPSEPEIDDQEPAPVRPVGTAEATDRLRRIARAAVERGDARPLELWAERELDGDGVPRRLPVDAWWECARVLGEARGRRPPSVEADDHGRIAGFARALLRFTRPDGASLFGPEGRGPVPKVLQGILSTLDDAPALGRVLSIWSPALAVGAGAFAAPPLPADARLDRPLAVLRPDWLKQGDLLAVDQRRRGDPALVELRALGRRWLGPGWSGLEPIPAGPTRVAAWTTSSTADAYEWTFRVGANVVTRSLVLVRGRKLALLSEQVEGPAPAWGWRVDLPPDVTARPIPDSRALALVSAKGKAVIQAVPFGLPASPHPTNLGSLAVEDGALVLRQATPGRRHWLAILLSWDAARHRKPPTWRPLTVAERSKTVPAARAVAARVSWGPDATVLIYRSLGPAGLRSALGYQTKARFLVAGFDRDGEVEPWLRLDG